MQTLHAPFPWFGGKSRVAHLVWQRFGDVPNYVEPFAGSLAVLLGRPTPPGIETVNDKDCYIANFWRALQRDPEEVARYADWPVNEADLHARHRWLVDRCEFRERMKTDPDYCDAKIAGWWVWGQSCWIGAGWCAVREEDQSLHRRRPHLGNSGNGVHRTRPHLRDAGMGVNRKIASLTDYMRRLAERLQRVRVCCGEWSRICGPSPTVKLGVTGVFLDPPYSSDAGRDHAIYATEDLTVAHEVAQWAREHGHDPQLRIALCGYEGEHEMPGWIEVAWRTRGGYGNQSNGRGRENRARERIWFSPHCLKPGLFDEVEEGIVL